MTMASEIFKQAVAAVLSSDNGLGVAAIFTPLTGSPVNLNVGFRKSTEIQPSGMAQTWELGTTVEYSLEDIAREAYVGETFTIDSTVYTVRRIERNNGYTVKVVVS